MTLRELVASIARLKGWKAMPLRGHVCLSIPQAGARKQVVAVSQFKDGAEPMLRYTTRIGKASALENGRLRAALEVNFRMPHGCLAMDGKELVLTETRPLRTTTPETSGDAIEFLARQADVYEKLIYNTDVH